VLSAIYARLVGMSINLWGNKNSKKAGCNKNSFYRSLTRFWKTRFFSGTEYFYFTRTVSKGYTWGWRIDFVGLVRNKIACTLHGRVLY